MGHTLVPAAFHVVVVVNLTGINPRGSGAGEGSGPGEIIPACRRIERATVQR